MGPFALALSPHAARLVAAVIVVTLYGFSRLPQLPSNERDQLATRFHFAGAVLPQLSQAATQTIRSVHPDLKHIAAWISSVGASVALNDLDGDGLSNDICYVHTNSDQVIVAPVPTPVEAPRRGRPQGDAPTGGNRFPLFALDPQPVTVDPATMAPMGCLPGDLNEDGRLDLLVYYWGRTPIAFLHRGATQVDAPTLAAHDYTPVEIVPGGERWFTNAATLADVDGDGHIDLILGNYFQDGAAILDETASGAQGAPAQGAAEMQHAMSRAYNGGSKRLLLWAGASVGAQPGVQFNDASAVFDDEVAHGWTLAVAAADLDGDLLPELYFANDFGPDRLLHNRSQPGQPQFARLTGEKGLTTPNSKVLGRDSFKGMGVDFGDLNGDGLLDIYVSNIAGEYSLEESHFAFLSTGELERMKNGVAPYVDHSEQLGLSRSGWAWESRLADFDNDGVLEAIQATGFVKGEINRWPELHELAMGNDELLRHPTSWPKFGPGDDLSGHQHNPFFVRAQDGRYYDLAQELSLDGAPFGPQVSRGIATGDVDGDGDLDFAVANQWEPSIFYRNECAGCGAYLGLHLRLPVQTEDSLATTVQPGHPDANTASRPAIGAAATLHLPDGRRLVAQVDGGNGHSGDRSPDLHFGLGRLAPDARLAVDIQWRSANGQVHQETLQLSPGWHTILLGN
jgi:hypothetical protein